MSGFEDLSGRGARGWVEGHEVMVGRPSLFGSLPHGVRRSVAVATDGTPPSSAGRRVVAMAGDGINEAAALAQADLGLGRGHRSRLG